MQIAVSERTRTRKHWNITGNAGKKNGWLRDCLVVTRGTNVIIPGDEIKVFSKTGAEVHGTLDRISGDSLEIQTQRSEVVIVALFTIKDIVLIKEAH